MLVSLPAPACRFALSFFFAILLALPLPRLAHAATDPRPVVGPGATKDEVINAYGWPNGQSQSGTKEILSYAQGNVTLENGRVEKVDFLPNVPWQTPRPRPGPPSPTSGKKEAPVDFWLTSYDEAVKEAVRRGACILALFTGADWSPASKQFHDEIEFHPDFVNSFAGDFVLLRLDYATRTTQSDVLREQNARLRQKYGVTSYPTLLVLSPSGATVAQVDLAKPQAGDSYRARVIAAVREVRDLLTVPPLPDPSALATPAPIAPPATETGSAQNALTAPLHTARWLLASAGLAGVGVAAFLLWLVWRKGTAPTTAPVSSISSRIADAASGIPTAAEVHSWPKNKVCGVVAGLAESDGYRVDVRPEGSDADLAFRRAGEARPSVLVCCVTGEAGVVPAKRMREFFGTMTVEGVSVGWFVAPAGFSAEAKAYAEQNGILPIDAPRLLAHLRDLPPLLLPKVLSRVG